MPVMNRMKANYYEIYKKNIALAFVATYSRILTVGCALERFADFEIRKT